MILVVSTAGHVVGSVPVNERVTMSGLGNCVLTICEFPFIIVLTAAELDVSAFSSICGEEKAEDLGHFSNQQGSLSLERSQKYYSFLKPYTDRKSTANKVMVKRHVHALHTSLHRSHACLQTRTIMFH